MVINEYVKSLGQSFIFAVIVFILLYIFLWPVRIVGVSMEPALNSGDRVFVSRAAGFVSEYRRGDLVMVRVYHDAGNRYIIKRIAAVPGDILVIDDEQIELYPNYYFLIGDNYAFSTDSRDFGPLHRSQLRGRVLFRFMGGNFNIY